MFYSPDDLVQFIKMKFKEYRDEAKPEGLKNIPEVKLDSAKETFEQFKQQPKETAQKVVDFIKFKVSEVPGKLRTHSAAIETIESEIDKIMAEEKTSPLKKMCDIAILIYGLSFYLNRRDSEQMIIFVTEIKAQLWAETPDYDETAFVKLFTAQIKNVCDHLDIPDVYALNYRSVELPADNHFLMEEVGAAPIANLGEFYKELLIQLHQDTKGKEEYVPLDPGMNDNNSNNANNSNNDGMSAKKPRRAENAYSLVDKIASQAERNRLGSNNFLVVMNSSQQAIDERDSSLPVTRFTGESESGDEEDTETNERNPFI